MDRVAMIDRIEDALKGLDEEPLKRLKMTFGNRTLAKEKLRSLTSELRQRAKSDAKWSEKLGLDELELSIEEEKHPVELVSELNDRIMAEFNRRIKEDQKQAKDPFHTLEDLKGCISDDRAGGSDYRALLLAILSDEARSAVAKVEILRLITRVLESPLPFHWKGWLNVPEGREQDIVKEALDLIKAEG
jgi:hypothetical protein